MQGELVPLPVLKSLFRTPIVRVEWRPILPKYYPVATGYGHMCLVIQQSPFGRPRHSWRNRIISENSHAFMLIYEQHVHETESHTFCLTLVEPCSELSDRLSKAVKPLGPGNLANLVHGVRVMDQQGWELPTKIHEHNLMYLDRSAQVCFDFTSISPSITPGHHSAHLFLSLKQCLMVLLSAVEPPSSFLLIKTTPYITQASRLVSTTSYAELQMLLNISPDMEVTLLSRQSRIISRRSTLGCESENNKHYQLIQNSLTPYLNSNSPTKRKIVKANSLEDRPVIEIKGQELAGLEFQDGKCVNLFQMIEGQQLQHRYMQEGSTYRITKDDFTYITVDPDNRSRDCTTVLVYPPVGKYELMNFLLLYFRCMTPKVSNITYKQATNTLEIGYITQRGQPHTLSIVLYDTYCVKQEQVCMLVQKSQGHQLSLCLPDSPVSDNLPILLSHLPKSAFVTEINLSDRHGLSEVGLRTYFSSPHSKNLQALHLTSCNKGSRVVEQTLQQIGHLPRLARLALHAEHSRVLEEDISVFHVHLTSLDLRGLVVSLKQVARMELQVLRLTQDVSLSDLKYLKGLKLKELKVKLVCDERKSFFDSLTEIMDFGGTHKVEGVIEFVQGSSLHTLKILDLSDSTCEVASMLPLLRMPRLQKMLLNNCKNIGNQLNPISVSINRLSLADSQISAKSLGSMLPLRGAYMELNLSNTNMAKHEMMRVISEREIVVENLVVGQGLYSSRVLERGRESQNVRSLSIDLTIVEDPQLSIFLCSLLPKVPDCNKRVVLLTAPKQQRLLLLIKKWLQWTKIEASRLHNLYINQHSLPFLLHMQQRYAQPNPTNYIHAHKISVVAEGCLIQSLPKLVVRARNQVLNAEFRVLPDENIDDFAHRFVHYVRNWKQETRIRVDLRGNRIIGPQVIKLLSSTAKQAVRSLNFQGCIFTCRDVIEDLFQFTQLNAINEGQLAVHLDAENFQQRHPHYLRLVQQLTQLNALHIECQQIEDVEEFYSFMTSLLTRSPHRLTKIFIKFTEVPITAQSCNFWQTLLRNHDLAELELQLQGCRIMDQGFLQICQHGLSKLPSLQVLRLRIPSSLCPCIDVCTLSEMSLVLNDNLAHEARLNECIRNIPRAVNLRTLRMELSHCSDICNLDRVFSLHMGYLGCIIEKLECLQELDLSFQFCPIREQSLFELLSVVGSCQILRKLQLSFSFSIHNISEFVNILEELADKMTKPMIKVICITENSRNYSFRTDTLAQKGIEFVV